MPQVSVLFDSVPISRLGYEKKTTNIVVGADFSGVAYMLEEYIAHGATSIAIPKSRPEVALLSEMPTLLADRVNVIDDSVEILAAGRLLFQARKEISATFEEESGEIAYPDEVPSRIQILVTECHDDIRRLAFGFNHQVQIDVNPRITQKRFRALREICNDQQTRGVLAHLEGLIRQYQTISYKGVKLKYSSPTETLSIFDRLINDASYVNYSTSIAQLSAVEYRERSLADIRRYGKIIRENKYLGAAWNIATEGIKVFTGTELPESKELRDLFPMRALPPLLDMRKARQRAIEMWRSAGASKAPLNSSGMPLADGSIEWLPPCPSLQSPSAGSRLVQFGTVGELLEILNQLPSEVRGDTP